MIVVLAPELPWLTKKIKGILIDAGMRADVVTADVQHAHKDVRCVVVDLDDAQALELLNKSFQELDGDESRSLFAVIGLTRCSTSEHARLAERFGIDDLVHTDELEGLDGRLVRLLNHEPMSRSSASRSWILLSGGEDGGLNNLARALA